MCGAPPTPTPAPRPVAKPAPEPEPKKVNRGAGRAAGTLLTGGQGVQKEDKTKKPILGG